MDKRILTDSELDHRLYKSNPVDRAALDDDDVRAALASVRRSVESGVQRQAPSRVTARPAFRRRWSRFGAATAAVAVASLAGVETLVGGGGGAGLALAVTPAAAAQLNRVAHAAAVQVTPGADQIEYLAEKVEISADPSLGNVSVAFTYAQTLQNWQGPMPAQNGRQRETSEGISFATPQDQSNYLANKSAFDSYWAKEIAPGVGTYDPTTTGLFADRYFPPHGVKQDGNLSPIEREVYGETEQPDGPKALIAELSAVTGAQPDDLWGDLVAILRDSSNAKLRATAYQALAYVPGTAVLGNRVDQLGREGVAIHFTHYANGPSDTLIVSPSTGYLLESDGTENTQAGTVTDVAVYLQRGIVDSVTALPGGGTQPLTSATLTVHPSGQLTPSLQTTTGASQTTTSSPQTSTTVSSTATSTTSTRQTTTATGQATSSTAQTTTAASQTTTAALQPTTSIPQSR